MMRYALLSLALILIGTNPAQAQISTLSELTRTIEKIKKTSDDTARVAKGASGQAVQNMNLMNGFAETSALLGAPFFP